MGFLSLKFHQFRNLVDGEINLESKSIFLVGENGQGKSNLLEALYFLSFGSSFRTRIEKEMVRHGESALGLHGRFSTPADPAGRLGVQWKEGNKEIRLYDKIVKDRKELLRLIPVIVFGHEDILFAGGPPERRRWFIDQTLSLHDPLYVDQLRRYRRVLKERNHLLKTGRLELLDHYSQLLASAGLALQERRAALMEEFNVIFTPLFGEISELDGEISIKYHPSWGENLEVDEVVESLRRRREGEINLKTTLTGPHRDRFLFFHQGRDFSKSASTGQLRLLSLVLRAAQAQFFAETTGRKPVLLLDDVLLELDPRRRLLFRDRLPEAEQRIYTFLPGEERGEEGKDALLYRVEKGSFISE